MHEPTEPGMRGTAAQAGALAGGDARPTRREILRFAGLGVGGAPVPAAQGQGSEAEYEVVVYGATPAGVMASVSAARVGARVVLVEPRVRVGGSFASGVCHVERQRGNRVRAAAGLNAEFYEAASGGKFLVSGERFWLPDDAEATMRAMLSKAGVALLTGRRLASVRKDRGRVRALLLADRGDVRGKVFVDSSYEGDLMVAAGVPFEIGREPATRYGESEGGVRPARDLIPVNPFDRQGLLPGLSAGRMGEPGAGDGMVACSQVRAVLTSAPRRRVPIQAPAGYDTRRYELLGRCLAVGAITKLDEIVTLLPLDSWGEGRVALSDGAGGWMSRPGGADGDASGSLEERGRIYKLHREHTHGLLWFLRTDRRVPGEIRGRLLDLGLCADLWPESGHWPPDLELREGRRMVGEVVITEQDLTERRDKTDSVSLGVHPLRCPVVARFAEGKDGFRVEGQISRNTFPFEIPWLAITPRRMHCENLLVPACLSASHVAWHALRDEQTRMALGEAAGIAAALIADAGTAVLDLDPTILQAKLRRLGLPIDLPERKNREERKR